ncbi:MAG: AsmA family protein [FCB group bacterium]|nr:AsmA family protein [FCB group bacterium]
MRKRFKIPLFTMVFIGLMIAAGLTLLYKSHLLENWVNRYLAEKIADQYNLEINISEIDGTFVRGFVLKNVLIQFRGEEEPINLAFFPQVRIRYQASNLWNRRWIIDSLKFSKPQISLNRDNAGKWVLPKIKGDGESDGQMPSWSIGSLIFENGELELSLADSSLNWYDIDLSLSAKSEEGTHTVNLDTLRFNSSDGRLRVNHASGKATLYDKNLMLQNIRLATDSSRAAFSLILENGDQGGMEAVIDSAHVHLPDIVSFLGSNLTGDFDISGDVYRRYGKTGGDVILSGDFRDRSIDSVQARFHYDDGYIFVDTLSGTILGGCAIAGFGGLDLNSRPQGYHLVADIESFNLNNLVFNSFTSDLSGLLNLDGRGFNSKTMAIDLNMDMNESYFDIYHLHRGQGEMTVTTSGLYFFPDFRIKYHDNRFIFGGDLNYKGDIQIEGRAEFDDLSDFAHQFFIDLPAGRADAEFVFSGPTKSPNLSGSLKSDSIWLYEFFSNDLRSEFDITDFVGNKKGPVTLKAYDGEAWKIPYDSLAAEFSLDSNYLHIESGYITNRFSRTDLSGSLEYENYPQVLTLDDLKINLTDRLFRADENQVIVIDSSGFIFDHVQINASDGNLAFSGRADYDETLDISWNINNVDIAPWANLINDSLYLAGRLSSTGRLGGKLAHPDFNLAIGIDSLEYKSLHLGDLTAYLSYSDSLLHIDSSFMTSHEGLYLASGEFPINLSMVSGTELFDSRQQRIVVSAEDKRLDLAAFVLESVEYMTGDFSAEFTLTGTPREPHLNGVSKIENGSLKLIDLRDRLEEVEIELTMTDQLIRIDRVQASVPHKKSKTPGKISAEGTIFLENINNFIYGYNDDSLRMRCEGMPINYELGKFTGMADAELIVDGPTPPTVQGTIIMHQATYRENFTDEESGFNLLTALEGDNTWDLDLIVDCPSNAWVKNDDIDAEFSGSINILRRAGIYNFLGTLEIIRGKYFTFAKTFNFEPGGQIIYEDIEEPDPRLNLEMSTRVRSQNPYPGFDGEDDFSFILELLLTGTLDKPIITGTGNTPLSTEEILPTLWSGYQSSNVPDSAGNESNGSDPFAQGVGDLLASQFSKIGTRSLGVETFEITQGSGKFDPLATRLTIGAYTLPNLYVFGSSSLNVEKGQEVGAEYRLDRHFLFEGRRDEYNLYHFSLKFFREFE